MKKKKTYPRIGNLAAGHFDEFESRLAEIRNLIATECVDVGATGIRDQEAGENRIATNVASAMEKIRATELP